MMPSTFDLDPQVVREHLSEQWCLGWNSAGRAITAALRFVLLGLIWLQLRGAQALGLLDRRVAERQVQ